MVYAFFKICRRYAGCDGGRDYIHVVDLAEGHLAALNWLVEQGGLFELVGYTADDKDAILRTKAPEMLYPYARELVGSLVSRAGFPRLQLRHFDFEKGYLRAMQEYRDATAGSAGKA